MLPDVGGRTVIVPVFLRWVGQSDYSDYLEVSFCESSGLSRRVNAAITAG